jgi:hypothetical protein
MKKLITVLSVIFLTACNGDGGKGHDTNAAAQPEEFALYKALDSMNTNRVAELFIMGYDVNQPFVGMVYVTNTNGAVSSIMLRVTPIEAAVMKWDVVMVSNLMIRGAIPTENLLMLAVERTNLALVKFLVSIAKFKTEPIDPETGDWRMRWAPLHIAAMNGFTAIADFLVNNGARIDIPDPSNQLTPMHLACSNNNSAIVKILLKKGALINPTDKNGATPLTYTKDEALRKYIAAKGGFDPELPDLP